MRCNPGNFQKFLNSPASTDALYNHSKTKKLLFLRMFHFLQILYSLTAPTKREDDDLLIAEESDLNLA